MALLAVTACSGSSSAPPVGVVVDSGFRPTTNGFTFANYGGALADGAAPTNLTPADVRSLFGDAVCVDAAIGKCDLTPEAQAWMTDMNQQMAGGHCFGFSVASVLFWKGELPTSTFGAAGANGLAIDDNTELQRALARGWVFQLLDSVQSKKITESPNKILDKLEQVLKPGESETYTIAIWKRDGTAGHAVTPYGVKYDGDGKYEVLIYDNNLPDAKRAISFDTKHDTWSYQASTNPDEADSLYEGDADTKTLSLFPTSPGRGPQPCPFCGTVPSDGSGGSTGSAGAAGAAPRTAEILLSGSATNHAHVLVTDQAGHRLGYVDGKLVNEIPGARFVLLTSDHVWQNKLEPVLFVPADVAYTITLDGTALSAPDTESISIIGPSWHVAVRQIPMQPGDTDTVTADPNATRLTYRTTRAKSPTIEASVSDARAHYAFVVSGAGSERGSTLNLHVPPEGGSLIIDNSGSTGTSSVTLQMTRSTEQGVQHFQHAAIPLGGGDSIELRFAQWTDPSQGIPLVTTHDGHQTTQVLRNE
jgi:hypothetical protein